MERFRAYVEANRERFIQELSDFCRQPSISTQNVGIAEMAELVKAHFERLGAQVQVLQTGGPPAIFAEIGQGERTLLCYNHYDVQPPDPLEEWHSPPFEPTIGEGKLYARGVADDKGDLMARIQAVETYLAVFGELPLRLKFFVEGEEETGSPHLAALAEQYADLLRADGCLWETGGKDEGERLTFHLGLKGDQYLELRCRGAKSDLHSANAGLVPNPAWRLVWALSTMKDMQDRITIDGYREHVRPPTGEELAALERIPFADQAMRQAWGIDRFINGVEGTEALRIFLYEPTCTISGFRSGYIEEGSKTVLPSTAMVKLDLRLVPDLTPELALKLVREHLHRRGFQDIEVVSLGSLPAARSPLDAEIVEAAKAAAVAVYGHEPVIYPTHGGSGPMYYICQGLGTPGVMAGVGYPGVNIHAPNENIRLSDYFEGILFVGELIGRFSRGEGVRVATSQGRKGARK